MYLNISTYIRVINNDYVCVCLTIRHIGTDSTLNKTVAIIQGLACYYAVARTYIQYDTYVCIKHYDTTCVHST